MKQSRVYIVPVTLPQANEWIALHHRHHAPLPGGFAWFCVGAVVDGSPAGVALAGRPTNRNNDDGTTVEILRVASDGRDNVCSALIGACVRASKAIGAARVITYTLANESGISTRAAGMIDEGITGRSFWGNSNTRTAAVDRAHFDVSKRRWVIHFSGSHNSPWPRHKRADNKREQSDLFAIQEEERR
jgi:hypothetical protein